MSARSPFREAGACASIALRPGRDTGAPNCRAATTLRPPLMFGDALVAFPSWGTLITWSDGTFVSGAPEDTDTYRKTALDYGYDADTLALCRDHELLHVALCHWLGVPSPVMDALRLRADMVGVEIRILEEAAVLAVQRFARAMGAEIIDAMAKHA